MSCTFSESLSPPSSLLLFSPATVAANIYILPNSALLLFSSPFCWSQQKCHVYHTGLIGNNGKGKLMTVQYDSSPWKKNICQGKGFLERKILTYEKWSFENSHKLHQHQVTTH